MRALTAPSSSSSTRRPLRLEWTVIADNPTKPRLTSRWVVDAPSYDIQPIARAA
jgi:hypothetical protein